MEKINELIARSDMVIETELCWWQKTTVEFRDSPCERGGIVDQVFRAALAPERFPGAARANGTAVLLHPLGPSA